MAIVNLLLLPHNQPPASVAIAVLVFLLAIRDKPSISLALGYVLGKLYSNTLLAVLNNRVYMSAKGITRRSGFATSGIDIKFNHPPATHSRAASHSDVETQEEPYRIEMFRETQVTDDLQLSGFKRSSNPNQGPDPGVAI